METSLGTERLDCSGRLGSLPPEKGGEPLAPLRILSLSCVYPNPADPSLGTFVRARIQAMARGAEVRFIAPLLPFDYAKRVWKAAVPRRRRDGRVEVLHPRWLYVPGTGALTALLLAAQMLPLVLRLRRQFDFQVIDAHFGYPDGIAAALLARATGRPFTVTLRGAELLHARYRLRRLLMRWALTRASRVIAVSEELRRFALGLGVDAARSCVIANGLDGAIFYPRDRAAARRKHGLAIEGKYILTAGHLIELKGHHRVVAALKQLHAQGIPAKLLIAGGRPGAGLPGYEAQIRQAIADCGLQDSVRLLGHVSAETLAELMAAVDVFCLASAREGWPNVVQEALGCGTPVVATRVGAVPEMLPEDSLGFIVPPGDVEALAEALHQALARAWDHAAIAAWARHRSWDQVADEVLITMRQIVREAEDTTERA